MADRARAYRTENGLAADAEVPVDAVTASGSGLDPAISVANADSQAARVARARGLDPSADFIYTDERRIDPPLGFPKNTAVVSVRHRLCRQVPTASTPIA